MHAGLAWRSAPADPLGEEIEDGEHAVMLPDAVPLFPRALVEHTRLCELRQRALGGDCVHPELGRDEGRRDDGVRDEVRKDPPGGSLGSQTGQLVVCLGDLRREVVDQACA